MPPMPQTKTQPMKPYHYQTIHSFFAHRPYLRPSDYHDYKDGKISKKRQRELTIYIMGYEAAKYQTAETLEP
jgi:hypothetical protein